MTATTGRGGMGIVLATVLATFSAQQLLTPVLAPLSRELRLTELQLGLVITVSAAALTVMSPIWGRALDRLGPRTVLLSGVGLATVGLAGFALAAQWGLGDSGRAGTTFTAMLVTRSVIFGAGIATAPVVGVALAAATTTDEASRTRAVSLVGAAQGVSLVLGPAIGGALATASLLLPLYVAPAVLAAFLVVLALVLAPTPATAQPETTPRARLSPFDRRLLPVLAVGFVVYLSLAVIQVVLGFLVADRLGLDAERTAGAVGIAFFAAGIVLVATQAVVVPRLRWPALRLLRTGVPLALVAFAVLAVAGQLWSLVAGMALLAAGLGLAMPGYTAAGTMVAQPHEHGAVSGLVNANVGLTFMLGPVLGTALYELTPIAPLLAAATLCAIAGAFLYLAPAARRIGAVPEPAVDEPRSV